jgi:hypothetical protein
VAFTIERVFKIQAVLENTAEQHPELGTPRLTVSHWKSIENTESGIS